MCNVCVTPVKTTRGLVAPLGVSEIVHLLRQANYFYQEQDVDSISTLKQVAYQELIVARRACRTCVPLGLTNPSVCRDGIYDDSSQIGPWSQWHGHLDATLMIVGQDWGGVDYYVEYEGREKDSNPTNRNLIKLLSSIGLHIELPTKQKAVRRLFFTNAVLCLKEGRLSGPVKAACFNHCGTAFLRKQIELVNSKVLVTLGHQAYRAVLMSYGLPFQASMLEAVRDKNFQMLPNGTSLIPVYHCGNWGLRSRSLAQQLDDWKRVETALNSPLPS